MDIFIEPENKNAERMLLVLSDFGFSDIGLVKDDFIALDQTIQPGQEPGGIDIH